MESNEIKMNQKLGEVRNYIIVLLIMFFILNMLTLGALHWIETNNLRSELAGYAETLPIPDINKPDQTINLPEDIIALRTKANDRFGFYETSIGGQDWLVYADPNKHYVLMKSEIDIQKETRSFAIALSILYLGEVLLLLGFWFFIRNKAREVFDLI